MSDHSPISIYALGGLCEVGKNTYCIESENSLIIIDAGVRFPEPGLLGVSYVIPDYSKLKSSRQKIKGLFITHGHEDHIGGIPFLIQQLHIPVIYAPRLAAALIKSKLEEQRIRETVKIVEYDGDSIIQAGEFKVSFFYVTHSIPDSYGICVDTPEGRIVHTGDFKIDLTPVGHHFDLDKVAKLGMEGVDLLLSDSTNAEIEGYTPSETNVYNAIKDIFDAAIGRVILSTFSSNINRIQQVVTAAVEHKRYIAIVGRSMEKAVQIARDFGYIKIPDNRIISIDDINKYPFKELCIICTGSQGEPMAALSRIANGDFKGMNIIPGDTVVFSSSAIPGNGVMIEKVVDSITKKGADVISNSSLFSVHSSGHPSKQELRLMLKLINPKYFMPIHGEYRMLKIHGQIAESLGIPKNNIFIMKNGDSIVLFNHTIQEGMHYTAEPVYIDGRDVGGLQNSVLADREILKNEGLVLITIGVDSTTNTIIVDPIVETRGFVSDDFLKESIIKLVNTKLHELIESQTTFAQIKTTIKNNVSRFIASRVERKPMVIPVIMDKVC